jgi:hypothetical protein
MWGDSEQAPGLKYSFMVHPIELNPAENTTVQTILPTAPG